MKNSILLVLIAISSFSFAQQKVRGTIFFDRNNNGLIDQGEDGIAKVAVSNGEDVVLTNRKGKYKIKLAEGQILFVSKPSGYEMASNQNNLPRFYYIHEPKGSPAHMKYEGVKPTGDLPETIDFPLVKTEVCENFAAYVTGDPQPSDKTQLDYYRDDILAQMLHEKANLYIALGDIMNDDLSLYKTYNEMVAQLGVPVYNVYGNHDVNYRAENREHAAETFKRNFGPTYYSFNYGKVHFVHMDNIDYKGWDKEKQKSKGYRGWFGEKQLTWLKSDLKHVPSDYLVVFSMHIPIASDVWQGEGVSVGDAKTFFDIVEEREHVLLLAGHMHIVEYYKFGENDGWKAKSDFWQITAGAGCGAWWQGPKDDRNIPIGTGYDGVPNGFYLFNFAGNKFNYKYIPAHKSEKFQMRIAYPKGTILRNELEAKQIVVNVFNASKYTKVMANINGVEIPLRYSPQKDSYMQQVIDEHRSDYASNINFPVHTHGFVGELPKKLPAGTYKLRIQTSDPFGNSYVGYSIFEVK